MRCELLRGLAFSYFRHSRAFTDSFSDGAPPCLFVFAAWLCSGLSPQLSRGNHETINMNKMYGFEGEAKHK